MFTNREQQIIDFVKETGECSSREIFESINISVSYATLKRILTNLKSNNYLKTKGKGKGTKYLLSPAYELICPIDIEKYYEKEIDERQIIESFNQEIITEVLGKHNLFSAGEMGKLSSLQKDYQTNISDLSENEYKKELERLAIDLSWKSSQIEGNTYTLLETERLLKEKETASGKTKEEAVMLLNHKDALDFIIENDDYINPLTVSKIEDIHRILTKELAVERNLRKRRVGITGTNYQPLDNEFQILEALRNTCDVINNKENVFEKALLAIILISYIQPFMDGNKRTARIVSNAILMSYDHCPLSFRTVDSIDYKKAMLLFYEQNNISKFKEIFINQFEFAVKTYF
jgi:Fic family protein